MKLLIILSVLMSAWSFKLCTPSMFRARNLISMSYGSFPTSGHSTARVTFGNLPILMKEEELKMLITNNAGSNFVSLRLGKDKKSSGSSAFIEYETVEEANAAIVSLSTLVVHERNARVELFDRSSSSITKHRRSLANQTCFIGKLSLEATEGDVAAMCEQYVGKDTVKKVTILLDHETGISRGFGYIVFNDANDVTKALEVMQGVMLYDREIFVDVVRAAEDDGSITRPSPSLPPVISKSASVFIGNLGPDVDEETLKDMLNDVVGTGVFQSVKMGVDRETGKLRGFAHVAFADSATAEMAVRELNGLEMMDRLLRVDLSDALGNKSGSEGRGGFGKGGMSYRN